MTGAESLGLALTQLHLACGRIASGARAIAEAHRFGVPEGPHDELWTAEYHGEAVAVYGESLPRSYQRDIASRSSLYRELTKLWRVLGVSDRAHAIRKAAQEGLLD